MWSSFQLKNIKNKGVEGYPGIFQQDPAWHVQAQSRDGEGRGEVGRTGGSGDLGKPSVDQSFWGKSTNMDLGYYSLCRWDGQNPCGFLCGEGGQTIEEQ